MNKEYSCLLNINKFKGGGTEIYNRKLLFSSVERLCLKVQTNNSQLSVSNIKLKTHKRMKHKHTHSNICNLWRERWTDYCKESEACI